MAGVRDEHVVWLQVSVDRSGQIWRRTGQVPVGDHTLINQNNSIPKKVLDCNITRETMKQLEKSQ